MSSEEIVPLLKQLGLNLYESEAYVALLTKGQISAKELGQVTSIPQSRTYDVLSSLKDKGLALSTPSADRTYTPVDPDSILKTLYGTKKKEIQTPMIRVQEETEQKLELLHGVYSEAKEKLSSYSTDHVQVVNNPVFVLEGYQNIETAMLALIDKAQSEFLRITKPPEGGKSMMDPFYFLAGSMTERLYRAKERGVKIRTISLIYEIPSLLGLDFEDEDDFERRYLAQNEDIPEKFLLADGHTVLLNLRDPVSKTFGSIALVLESDPTCTILHEHFESMWKKAEPVSSLSKRMREATEELCKLMQNAHYSRFDVAIYRALAKKGVQPIDVLSRSFGKHTPSEVSAAVRKLTDTGLVVRNDWLKSLMAENPLRATLILEGAANGEKGLANAR